MTPDEYEDMKKFPQFGLEIDKAKSNIWYVSFKGAEKTLYEIPKTRYTLKVLNICYIWIFRPDTQKRRLRGARTDTKTEGVS